MTRPLGRYVFLVAAAGSSIETVAFLSRMWEFADPAYLIVQIVGFYGIVMGGLCHRIASQHPVIRFLAGFGVGGLAEVANHAWMGAWAFPDDRVWGLAVPLPGLLALAVAWGFIPLLAPIALRPFVRESVEEP